MPKRPDAAGSHKQAIRKTQSASQSDSLALAALSQTQPTPDLRGMQDPAPGMPAVLVSWEPFTWPAGKGFSFSSTGLASTLPDSARIIPVNVGTRTVGRSAELGMLSAIVSRKQAQLETYIAPGPVGYHAPCSEIIGRVRTILKNMGVNPMYVWRKGERDPILPLPGKPADADVPASLELQHGDVLVFLMCAFDKATGRPTDENVVKTAEENALKAAKHALAIPATPSSSTGSAGKGAKPVLLPAPPPWTTAYLRGPRAHMHAHIEERASDGDFTSWTTPHTVVGAPLDQAPRLGYIWVYRVNEAAIRAGACEDGADPVVEP